MLVGFELLANHSWRRLCMTDKREISWDVVKGFAIIAVILIHTTSSDSMAGVVWRQFINWPVALFFFIGGYFCHVHCSYRAFIIRKIRRLLVPLGVVSLCYMTIDVAVRVKSGVNVSFPDVVVAFLSFPFGWGYFILALFQCFLMVPFILKLPLRKSLAIAFGGYLLALLWVYLGSTICVGKVSMSYMMPYVFGTTWLPFFVLGCGLQKKRFTWPDNLFVWMGFLLCILCVAIISGIWWSEIATVQLARSQIRLSCGLFAFVLSLGLPNLFDRFDLAGRGFYLIAQLGQISLFAYLWHRLVLLLFRKFLPSMLLQIPLLPICVILFFVLIACIIPAGWRRRFWWIGF